MPIYEYQCDACKHKFEVIQKVSDPLLSQCPACSEKRLRKLVSAAAFQLKGTGWYATDFKDKPRTGKGKESSASGDGDKAGSGDSAKSDKSGSDTGTAGAATTGKAAAD